ncbi:MAG: rod shape-determining protein MreC [Gammaproteobacteria bacterium]|jgi:rod shape-determining protein MreC|nr:rod shape-determining protein MreC [Gammaproteobacteria bacterium]MBT4194199.1 rod shape-determining protein MreC [Gammaproteobacteria bacterium]MBT4450495.1 rod shape-determining protein MreC [Gammaproteobacteria bacterium]MBT6454812.1 rod shape-determining protein MreC [Gammaproteobacteria bacterium]MBT6552301.1 rod shape-determining protein MreC [Gammaproteobacteria bacterium]
MKNIFQPARGTVAPALFLIALSISIMFVDQRFTHLESVRSGISVLVSPLRYLVSLPAMSGTWVAEWFNTHNSLVGENRYLKQEERLLNARLQKMDVLLAENTRLRQLLGASRKLSDEVIVTELLSVDQNPYRQLIELNKGSLDGLKDGQAVIDDYGIMGQIIHVGHNSSTVKLISDPEHVIPVQFIHSGMRSVAFGNGSTDELELRYLPATASIKPGDELVTSGLGGRFPADYPVATITHISLDKTHGFKSAIARPKARLDSSREVLVIQSRENTTEE